MDAAGVEAALWPRTRLALLLPPLVDVRSVAAAPAVVGIAA